MNCEGPDLGILEQHLKTLQRRRRLLQIMSLLLVVTVTTAGLLLAQDDLVQQSNGGYSQLESRAFVVKTAAGNVRGLFACSDNGGPFLELRDEDGKRRVLLKLDDATHESQVLLYDSKGRSQLGQLCQGQVSGVVLREEGVDRGRSHSLCLLADGSGKDSGQLTVYGDGNTPAFQLRTRNGEDSWILADNQGTTLAEAP